MAKERKIANCYQWFSVGGGLCVSLTILILCVFSKNASQRTCNIFISKNTKQRIPCGQKNKNKSTPQLLRKQPMGEVSSPLRPALQAADGTWKAAPLDLLIATPTATIGNHAVYTSLTDAHKTLYSR